MKNTISSPTIKKSFFKAFNGFISITPMLIAVILLIGVFQTYVTTEMLKTLFGYNTLTDIFTATLFGGISSGNPITSYIISEELLNSGISLYAASAFVLSWVTLGIIQLPAEATVFGVKFTVLKNLLTLISTMCIAYLCVVTLRLF